MVVALTAAIVAPASAQLAPTEEPLRGSAMQGGDGDQDDAPPLIDWERLEGEGRVRHSEDPNESDTAFDSGEVLYPGGWALTAKAGGASPPKSNVLDAWSVVDQPGGETFLYFGFTREASKGTTALTFELNHDDRLWDNGRAKVPCRRDGDVLISYEPAGNDPTVEVAVSRWQTTETDAGSGCARRGKLTELASLQANVEVQAAMNSAPIDGRLPGLLAGRLGTGHFGEASLNLSRLLERAFGAECLAFGSVWMHTRASDEVTSAMQDYVAPQPLAVRTCSASGVKFFDANANGERDAGERGIPRFLIWADYDEDGAHDEPEPFSVSDSHGEYVIHEIRPPDGTYMLREKLLDGGRARALAATWICSQPSDGSAPDGTGSAPGGRFGCGWGPIDVEETPYATGRDFGNWFPARLTVEKELEPADAPGGFDLLVNGEPVLAAAGDGDSVTVNLPPGVHSVSERPGGDTDAADFRSTVECRRDAADRGERRPGTVYASLELAAGQRATCTFRNLRRGVPAIAIRKTGPVLATAGDTLDFRFLVTNPGDVAFPAGAVKVADPACDGAPTLVDKLDGDGGEDGSPATLDPGDTWVYGCSRATAAGAACKPGAVANTAAVSGAVAGATVTDEDSIVTALLCPDRPEPPPPPPAPEPPPAPQPPPAPPQPPTPPAPSPPSPSPQPSPPQPLPPPAPLPGSSDEPGPVTPPGPRPPNAGDAAIARLELRRATRRCLRTRIPRVSLRGTRIDGVRIYVDGRLRRGLDFRTLQSRVRPRVTLPPGRHRVTARVSFERGSGTPPLTLTRTVRVCPPPSPPRFTG